jgi:hypothetical protein
MSMPVRVSRTPGPGFGVIVGVEVINIGSDLAQLPPMVEQLHRRYGRRPDKLLADGGFTGHDALPESSEAGCAPVPQPRRPGRAPHQPIA